MLPTPPLRVLMLPRYGVVGASSRLRLLQYLPYLRAFGFEVECSPLLDGDYVTNLYSKRTSVTGVVGSYLRRLRVLLSAKRFDVIWVEKEVWPWLSASAEFASISRSARVVVDYDDAVFHRYDQHQVRVVRWIFGRKIDKVMRHADLVTVGNQYLAERAAAAGAKWVELVPTVIDLDRYPPTPPRVVGDEVVIGWIGSPATADYLHILTPALEAIRERHSVRCIAIGARPDQLQGTPFEAVPWTEADEVRLLHEFDLGVMPLEDGPWERGKCGYKLIQYMACDLPVIASPVGVNSDIVEPGVTGYLASTTEQWIHSLNSLISKPDLRLELGVAGRKKVEQTYCLQVQAPRVARMLGRLSQREGG